IHKTQKSSVSLWAKRPISQADWFLLVWGAQAASKRRLFDKLPKRTGWQPVLPRNARTTLVVIQYAREARLLQLTAVRRSQDSSPPPAAIRPRTEWQQARRAARQFGIALALSLERADNRLCSFVLAMPGFEPGRHRGDPLLQSRRKDRFFARPALVPPFVSAHFRGRESFRRERRRPWQTQVRAWKRRQH